MKRIYDFLNLTKVKDGIKSNLEPYKNEDSEIENNLYYSKEKNMYLVECRLFNKDNMENAYLDIFNEDMTHFDEYVDDVWSFANWSIIK